MLTQLANILPSGDGWRKKISYNRLSRFLPRDAMLSAVYAVVVCLSVCLCVCVCVCHTPVGLYQNG